jgi:hypothetical protein
VLVVACAAPSCRGARRLPVDILAPRWGDLTVSEVLGHLRCRTCGERPGGVVLRRLVTGSRPSRADLVLHLLGPGATRRR